MPTKTDPQDGSAGERATLFSLRGHLIGQLPLWRIAPFVLIGGGALGTRGSGANMDPTFNFGVGVKFFASKYTMIRIDLRDSIGDHFDRDAGGTHYPEILLGMSFTLNRRSDGARTSRPRMLNLRRSRPKACNLCDTGSYSLAASMFFARQRSRLPRGPKTRPSSPTPRP